MLKNPLNMLLLVMVTFAISMPMLLHAEKPILSVQIQPSNMEVTREVYRAIYTASLSCDIEAPILKAMADNKITFTEAITISELCEVSLIKQANQPFARGMLKQELNYIKTGGTSM